MRLRMELMVMIVVVVVKMMMMEMLMQLMIEITIGMTLCRDWMDKAAEEVPTLVEAMLPDEIKPAAIEATPYLLGRSGHSDLFLSADGGLTAWGTRLASTTGLDTSR